MRGAHLHFREPPKTQKPQKYALRACQSHARLRLGVLGRNVRYIHLLIRCIPVQNSKSPTKYNIYFQNLLEHSKFQPKTFNVYKYESPDGDMANDKFPTWNEETQGYNKLKTIAAQVIYHYVTIQRVKLSLLRIRSTRLTRTKCHIHQKK